MNILLVCANGASTGILVEKMKNFAGEHEVLKTKAIKIDAISVETLRKYLDVNKAEVVLIAPQIRFKEATVKEVCEPQSIKVGVIDTSDYGRMNAAGVLKYAIDLYKS
jgi:cellobiose PTS system EIIB component